MLSAILMAQISLRLRITQKVCKCHCSFSFLSRQCFRTDCHAKRFLCMTYSLLSKTRKMSNGLHSLDTIKSLRNNCFQRFECFFVCDASDLYYTMCFILLTVTSIHSIRKITKLRNSEKRWKVTQKISLFKVQKTEKSS